MTYLMVVLEGKTMTANNPRDDWGDEPTCKLPSYRLMTMGGPCGLLIHVTPIGAHVIDTDCDDGICSTCFKPLAS